VGIRNFHLLKTAEKTFNAFRRPGWRLPLIGGILTLAFFNHAFSQTPITVEGINFNMSKLQRIFTLRERGYDCSLKQSKPYRGYWQCANGKKTILMGQSEAYFSCHVLGNCALKIAEIAQTLRQTYQIDAMLSSVFYRDVGRFNWNCGKDKTQGDQICVQKLVRVDHQMIQMMLGDSNEENLDPITRFLLSFRRPYVHLKRLNKPENSTGHREDIMSAG